MNRTLFQAQFETKLTKTVKHILFISGNTLLGKLSLSFTPHKKERAGDTHRELLILYLIQRSCTMVFGSHNAAWSENICYMGHAAFVLADSVIIHSVSHRMVAAPRELVRSLSFNLSKLVRIHVTSNMNESWRSSTYFVSNVVSETSCSIWVTHRQQKVIHVCLCLVETLVKGAAGGAGGAAAPRPAGLTKPQGPINMKCSGS